MATAIKSKTPARPPLQTALQNPMVAGVGLVIYVGVVLFILLTLNRRDPWFPLHTTLAFPPLVLAPFLIMGSSLPRIAKVIFILVILTAIVPIIGIYDSTYLELIIQICIFSALALGLNIVVGYAGLLDLGYMAFFLVGAYLWGIFTSAAPTIVNENGWLVSANAFYLFIPLGVVFAGMMGILLGLPVLRLRGDYLAIVTLGFGEVLRVLANNLNDPVNITNGAQGLHGVAAPSAAFLIEPIRGVETFLQTNFLPQLAVAAPAPLAQQMLFYILGIVLIGIIMLLANRLDDSPIGRAWTAIREDEVAAIAMGVPLVRMKLMAFATGAACGGAIGVLYAAKQTFVSPESFSLLQSINILAMVIIGGMGGIRGALFGAALVTLINLHVLTNFALLINNLRNINYIVSGSFIQIVIIVLFGLAAYLVWRAYRNARITRTIGLIIVALLGILALISAGDFPIASWPSQLTPDKYQRFVFGILLVVMMIFRPEGLLPAPRRAMELKHDDEPIDELTLEAEKLK
jgi:branched-chain amino acid transport system permease protein